MKRILPVPAWLLAMAIFAQVLMVALNVGLIYETYRQPKAKAWTLDSTTYYKFLEEQGKLNFRLYDQQQAHSARLDRLDKKRKAAHRRIDSLSGDALQREIDRQYNNTRQQSGTPNPTPRPQTNPADRSGGTAGTEGQSRPDHAARRSSLTGYPVAATTAGHRESEYDYPAAQRAATSRKEPGHDCPIPSRSLPDKITRGPVGNVAVANRAGDLRGRQTQTFLTYWRLIQKQGYVYPDVAWAISAVETGYWWSETELAKRGYNLFGFKKSGRRVFYVSITSGGYCRYTNKTASLADYGDYERHIIRKYAIRSRTDYLHHIQRRFCPSPSYAPKLALALKKFKALA